VSNKKLDNVGEPKLRVIEECTELAHALCKAKRFGYFSSPIGEPSCYVKILDEWEDVKRNMAKVLGEIGRLPEPCDDPVDHCALCGYRLGHCQCDDYLSTLAGYGCVHGQYGVGRDEFSI
jgi:hypothetical protein